MVSISTLFGRKIRFYADCDYVPKFTIKVKKDIWERPSVRQTVAKRALQLIEIDYLPEFCPNFCC